jgi:hypothetical protein
MRTLLAGVFALLCCASLLACTGSQESAEVEKKPVPLETEAPPFPAGAPIAPADSIVSGMGTVQYINLEGGFYGIVNDELGTRYVPDSLARPFRIDGLRVSYRALVQRDAISIRMWGTPVELISIEKL